MAGFGERLGGGRDTLSLRECPLESGEPLACETGFFAELPAAHLRRRRARRKARPARSLPKGLDERGSALAAQLQPLAPALQPVERGRRRLALSGGVRQLLLGAVTLGEQLLELGLRPPLPMVGRRLSFGRLADPLVDRSQVQRGHGRLERCDLAAELLGPLRGARLESERPEPLLDLGLDVPRPRDVLADARELQLGAVPAALELPQPRRLLDECAALLGLRRQDLLDLALGDGRACGAAEPDVCQQLHQVGAANRGTVHQVLPLASSVQTAHDGHLGGQVGQCGVLVVEHELDLAVGDRLSASPSREQHVVGLLGAELVRAQAPRRPQQRIGHVRLPGAVRPDDHGDARLEAHLDRFGKDLKPRMRMARRCTRAER